jgi:protein-disulfide isomerase
VRHPHTRAVFVFTLLIILASALTLGGRESTAVGALDGAVSVPDADRPMIGSADSPAVMVVFTDYQCRYCKRFFEERLPELRQRYVDSGRLRVVVRDMPLAKHKRARPAAVAAACAARQDRYWQMHGALYARQDELERTELSALAGELGMDRGEFDACVEDPTVQARIDDDLASAKAAKVAGTPAFLIGKSKAGKVTGRVFTGFQPISVYEAEIREYAPAPDNG